MSAARRRGGTGFTVEPTVCFSGAAVFFQIKMLTQTRKTRAVSLAFQERRLLISRIRKRWPE